MYELMMTLLVYSVIDRLVCEVIYIFFVFNFFFYPFFYYLFLFFITSFNFFLVLSIFSQSISPSVIFLPFFLCLLSISSSTSFSLSVRLSVCLSDCLPVKVPHLHRSQTVTCLGPSRPHNLIQTSTYLHLYYILYIHDFLSLFSPLTIDFLPLRKTNKLDTGIFSLLAVLHNFQQAFLPTCLPFVILPRPGCIRYVCMRVTCLLSPELSEEGVLIGARRC